MVLTSPRMRWLELIKAAAAGCSVERCARMLAMLASAGHRTEDCDRSKGREVTKRKRKHMNHKKPRLLTPHQISCRRILAKISKSTKHPEFVRACLGVADHTDACAQSMTMQQFTHNRSCMWRAGRPAPFLAHVLSVSVQACSLRRPPSLTPQI